MSILGNSEDPEEIPHISASHHGLHLSLRQKRSVEEEIQSRLDCIKLLIYPEY